MNKLAGVNILIEGLGDPDVASLGVGDAGEAETFLDRETARVLRDGWAPNIRERVELTLPDRAITTTGGTGSFVYDEVVTQATTLATGYFRYEEDGVVYLKWISGIFDGANALSASVSTRPTTTAVATITSAKHAVPESYYLSVEMNAEEWRNLTVSGGFLYDIDEDTTTFTNSVFVDIATLLDWDSIPGWLQDYIATRAAVKFQRHKLRGITNDQMLVDNMNEARTKADDQDQRLRKLTLNKYSRISSPTPRMPL